MLIFPTHFIFIRPKNGHFTSKQSKNIVKPLYENKKEGKNNVE